MNNEPQKSFETNEVRPFDRPPEHMDKAARNMRLMDTLVSMGLYVTAIPDSTGRIDSLIVSTGVPDYVPHFHG